MLRDVREFALERWFARWEFAVAHQLSASDVEPLSLQEVLALADDDGRKRWDALTLGYTESAGLPALRDAIASLYTGITAADVIVTSGAEEAIFLLMHALLAPGESAAVITPAYQSLYSLAGAIGAHVHRVALRWNGRAWALDLDELQRATRLGARAVIVNFPHNPTGAHLTTDEQRQLVGMCDATGAILISDEVYRGLEHTEDALLPAAADLHERAVSIGVMSKTFALAGLRIGWIATRDAALREQVARLRDYTTICNSAPAEVLALMALRAQTTVVGRSRAIVQANLGHVREFMQQQDDVIEWRAPAAGSTAFPRFRRADAAAVAQQLIESHDVLLLPGSVFDEEAGAFRLGLGRRDLPQALAALGHALRG